MKIHRGIKIVFIILSMALTCCDFADDKLIIINDSSDSLAFIIPSEPNYFPTIFSDDSNVDKKVNDSLLNTYALYNPDPNMESFGGVHFLNGHNKRNVMTFNIYWEQIIDLTKDKRLEIIFFPAYIMTSGKYKWIDIWNKKLYLEKHNYTKEELQKSNWTIHYK